MIQKFTSNKLYARKGLGLRQAIFASFIFAFVATLSFFTTKGLMHTEAASTADFKAGNIITDYVMSNYTSMTEAQIQSFMKSKNSCNDTNTSKAQTYSSYTYHIKDGHFVCLADETFVISTGEPNYNNLTSGVETAAHIIYEAAQDYKINPQVLLVLLQKEQGLITDTWPNNRQLAYATGYGCPDDSQGCRAERAGFKKQIRFAADLFRTVLDGGWTNYPVGYNYIQYNADKSCGGSTVYVENLATSSLYRYTPYQPNAASLAAGYGGGVSCGAYGNRNFFLYFTDWFGSTQITIPTVADDVANGIYRIASKINTSFVLDVNGGYKTAGANLQLWGSNGTDAQKFQIVKNSDNETYTITNVNSGLNIAANTTAIKNGTNVYQTTAADNCAQKWKIYKDAGFYLFLSACSDNMMVLDANNGIANYGTNVQIYQHVIGASAQRWQMTYLSGPKVLSASTSTGSTSTSTSSTNTSTTTTTSTGELKNGTYAITSYADAAKALDLNNAGTENGTNIHLYMRWGGSSNKAQLWKVTKLSDGTYTFVSPHSGKAMDVSGGAMQDRQNVWLYEVNGTCAQKWKVTPMDNGTYKIASACNNKFVLDLSFAQTANGTNIQIYPEWGGTTNKAQYWYFTAV